MSQSGAGAFVLSRNWGGGPIDLGFGAQGLGLSGL